MAEQAPTLAHTARGRNTSTHKTARIFTCCPSPFPLQPNLYARRDLPREGAGFRCPSSHPNLWHPVPTGFNFAGPR